MNDYHPTLWRTCRVLANPQRLACLREVLRKPDSTVEDVAAAVSLPPCKASLALRALQSRGLLSVRRRSRWAHYRPEPDPLVSSAAPALAAVSRALTAAPQPEREILRTLTAFTHPRRLDILRLLASRRTPLIDEAIGAATQISPPALARHLRALEDRGLVQFAPHGWRTTPKPPRLARALLALLADAPR